MGFACPKGWLNISRKTYSSSAWIFLCELYTCCGGLTRNQMGLSYFSMERFPTFLVSEHQSFGWLLVSTMSWIDYVLVYMPYICIYIYTVCTCPEACPLFGWRSFQFFLVRCISSSWVKDEDGWTLIASSLIQALVWSVHPSEGTTHMAIKLSFIKSFP